MKLDAENWPPVLKFPVTTIKKLFRTMAKIYKINFDVLIKFYIAQTHVLI